MADSYGLVLNVPSYDEDEDGGDNDGGVAGFAWLRSDGSEWLRSDDSRWLRVGNA